MIELYGIRPDLAPTLQAELDAGETIRWAGQPRQGLNLATTVANQPQLLLIVPILLFSLLFIMGMFPAFSAELGFFPIVFGFIFIVQFGNLAFTFWRELQRRSTTVYIITNKRVLIIQHKGKVVRSFLIRAINDLELHVKNNAERGSVQIGPKPPRLPGRAAWMPTRPPMLEDIENPGSVYEMIRANQWR